jgi:VanZ family protein
MTDIKKQKNILIPWAAVVLWLVFIFYLSAQPVYESNMLSKRVTEVVVETVEKVAPESKLDVNRMNHLLRKNAHFFAYLMLGILMMNLLGRSGVGGTKGIVLALGICVLYAISDEVHQLFVPGRGAQVRDVLIDSAGAIIGIRMYSIYKSK